MKPEHARWIALLLAWSIWLATVFLVYSNAIPKIASALLMLFGVVPYLVSIHVVEPWLSSRDPGSEGAAREDSRE